MVSSATEQSSDILIYLSDMIETEKEKKKNIFYCKLSALAWTNIKFDIIGHVLPTYSENIFLDHACALWNLTLPIKD